MVLDDYKKLCGSDYYYKIVKEYYCIKKVHYRDLMISRS